MNVRVGNLSEMRFPQLPATVVRQELEQSWRPILEEAKADYHAATERYRKLLLEQPEGVPPSPDGDLALARQAESQALSEYTRALRILTETTIRGKMPEERSAASSEDLSAPHT